MWTVEDGGRIRHRNPAGVWSYQPVPAEVQDVLQRVHFLSPEYQVGWAVGQNGWILKTVNGGATWTALFQKQALGSSGANENLYDVHFVDASTGWLVGEHGLWTTTTGGTTENSWIEATVHAAGGSVQNLAASNIGLYAIDVVVREDEAFALLTGKPGRIWRSIDPGATAFELVFDFHTWCQSTSTTLTSCESAACAAGGGSHSIAWFQAWDIELSRDASPLAVMVGGFGTQCGTILASTDDGTTWSKEFHECEVPGANCTGLAYNSNPSDLTHTWRHQSFKALYGVGIFDGDNSAVAAGYNGQQVYRDETTSNPVLWRDRSNFSNRPIEATTATVFPLYGAVADAATRTSGSALIVGTGGHVRRTTTSTDAWTDELDGSPFRTTGVHFETQSTGWQVGQFFRITKTTDGGLVWIPQQPEPQLGTSALAAITFKPGGLIGVTVGAPDNRSGSHTAYQYQPKILRTTDGGNTTWVEPDSVTLLNTGLTDGRVLRDVAWAAGDHFWAVGQDGTVLHSSDNGANWVQHDPSTDTESMPKLAFQGVAFLNANHGVVVGRNTVTGAGAALAYQNVAGSVTWYDIKPSTGAVLQFTDVAILGTSAYACGEAIVGGARVGTIHRSDFAGGAFGAFVPVSSLPSFSACTVGDDLGRIAVLNQIAVNASNDDLWVGGECGRMWRRTGSGAWSELKSQSSGHVVGLSLTSSGHLYVSTMRQDVTQQGLTGWNP